MIDRIAIFDLDETLCNTQHRIHHRIKGNHAQYNNLMRLDEGYADAIRLFNDIQFDEKTAMYISTGRPECFWIGTQKWLADHDIRLQGNHIYMRGNYDETSDAMVKLENLKKIRAFHAKGTPVITFDDRHQVIRMYRSQNVTALQIRKGEY